MNNERWITTWSYAQRRTSFTRWENQNSFRIDIPNNLSGYAIKLKFSNWYGIRSVGIRQVSVCLDGYTYPVCVDGKSEFSVTPEQDIYSEPVFLEKFPVMQQPIHCLFNAAEGDFDEVNAQVGAIAQYSGLTVQTRLTAEAEFKETQYTYSMVGIVSALILGGIGVLNLINMILTGVIARQKEFASMRSIGMTKKQLRKMIVYEGMYYAVLAGVVGIAASGVLSLTLVRVLAETMWFMKYDFTVLPAVLTSIICLLLAVYICAMTDKVWNKGSIVEQLREIE